MDSQAGLSHRSSPGRPSLDIRMTTCQGFGFSGKVSCSGEHALSGSKLERLAGDAGRSRQLFKANRLITESGSEKAGRSWTQTLEF